MSTTRLRVSRRIDADPTSTALLLAGPGALELWPGVLTVGPSGRRARVDAELLGSTAAVEVRALPPQRTPTAFLTRFDWSGTDVPEGTGELRLTAVPRPVSAGSPPRAAGATVAELVLGVDELEGTRFTPLDVERMARTFLDNLAAVAEQRNRAA